MTTEERLEKTFAVSEAPQLHVSNIRGTVTVMSDERNDIQVTAVKHPEAGADPERTTVEIFQEGNRVIARTRHQKKYASRKGQVCPVDYTVRVPSHCDVEVRQVSGTVHVSGVSGRVDVNAVQGAVQLREIDGNTQVKAVTATVQGDNWCGRARLTTVSGPVRIAGAQLSRIKASTVSADLTLETSVEGNSRYDFNSVSGDITFYLPSERGVELRGSTISGHLLCDLPQSRGGWRATINGGGPPIRFNSVSGDLEVLKAELT
jgi:DUF4097 and DUF4098 domain-containing protein YvlB